MKSFPPSRKNGEERVLPRCRAQFRTIRFEWASISAKESRYLDRSRINVDNSSVKFVSAKRLEVNSEEIGERQVLSVSRETRLLSSAANAP